MPENKDKYLQIFNFLLEFSKIRSKPLRNIEAPKNEYIEKLWLNDIPENELFESILWADDLNSEKDYWLKIRKPKEPNKPKIADLPKTIKPWVEVSTPFNHEEIPVLKETIEKSEGVLSIKDYPDIEQEFSDYIQGQWLKDVEDYQHKLQVFTEKHKEYESLNAIYTQIFRIYNKSKQFGEEYELVMGVGLLNFKQGNDSAKVYRHVITQAAHVKVRYFNEKMELLVSPTDESILRLETDSIIDLPEFDQNNIIDAERKSKELIIEKEVASVFDEYTHDALRIFSQTIYLGNSDYTKQPKKPEGDDETPKVYFAPALLLRKRNTKSLSALYEKILDNISNADDDFDIPSFNDLINDDGHITHAVTNDNFTDETIYFPDKYNDEQIQIIEKSRRSNKVLVQGPPGTGKSHTIANLICHLLAHGNKVLVTAYTQRALEVLKDKLPKEFQDLTVSLLGGDSSSIQGLDKNVNTISGKAANSNLTERKGKIESLEQELSEAKERKAFNINELIKIKKNPPESRQLTYFIKAHY